MSHRILRLPLLLSAALLSGLASAAAPKPPIPTVGGEPGADLTCVPMPESPTGHFVCEDPDSYQRCKTLEGKGKVLVQGETKPTSVLLCQQGG
ncbi:MAG: hypothetical protein Q8Q73_02470 [Stagnimonas sp.]|nr:hypothetical protein [Stagnimonas sp.]